ncbi:MAG TPA: HAMP domain-containing protein [Caldilineaceae bacterium]|nr:HAMP domain-containing protein [Caldilineaceae bacterium]
MTTAFHVSPGRATGLRGWLERLLELVTGVSVSTKIMGIVLALTISLGLGVTLQVRSVMTNTLLAELDNRGESVASDLSGRAASLILDGNFLGLNLLLADTLHNHPDTRYAFVLDPQGHVLAHAYGTYGREGDAEQAAEVPPEVIAANPALPRDIPHHVHYIGVEGQLHDFSMPILDGRLGTVRLGLAETRLLEIVAHTTERMLLTTAAVALIGILAALLLTWLLTRPILDLVTSTERLRQGDLSVRAPRWTDDEIGALADAFNQMVAELEASHKLVAEKERARTHLLSRLISAQEEERKRIARELHDGVGQALTSILVHIRVLEQSGDSQAEQARMAELRRLVDETLAAVRLLSRELRPSALDDLGLAAALERYVAEFRVRYPHLTVDLHCDLGMRLPSSVETSLYRIIQEAMTNAARHSQATALSVVVFQREGKAHAIIEDNGRGFDVATARRAGSSVGLHSMVERSELLGGTIDIESSGEGTTVYVEIPIELPEELPEGSAGEAPPEGAHPAPAVSTEISA